MNEQIRKALELAREALMEVDDPKAWPFEIKQARQAAIAAIDAALSDPAAPVAQPAPGAPMDAQILAAARAMNKLAADACNVNEGDSWALYGESYIIDAAVVLKAAHGIGQEDA